MIFQTTPFFVFPFADPKLKYLDLLTCSKVAVNLRLLVYRYGMSKSGNEEKWDIMFERYRNSTLAQEKDKLLYGLASVNNEELLYRYLQ